jgi:hypothetical protein
LSDEWVLGFEAIYRKRVDLPDPGSPVIQNEVPWSPVSH